MRSRVPYTLALTALLLASCDSEGDMDAGSSTDAPAPDCSALPTLQDGTDGHSEPLGADSGQVRAGRLTADALPADPNGLGVWAEGDFVIANDRFALLVEDAGESDLYDPHGGRPVGIAANEGGTLVRAGDFNEILFGYGPYLVATEEVSVLQDGSDGGTAIIRARGPLAEIEFAGELLAGVLNTDDFTGFPAALDYEMAPDSDAVELWLTLQQNDPERGAARTSMLLTAFFQKYRMPLWVPGTGFASPEATQAALSFIDDRGTSYTFAAPPERSLTSVLDISGVLAYSAGREVVGVCEEKRIHLGTIIIGGSGLGGLQASLAGFADADVRTVNGSVSNADGSAATDVRVHVRRADGSHYARLNPSDDGTFSVDVPREAVTFHAYRRGMSVVDAGEVGADTDTVEITMPDPGRIRVAVTETGVPDVPIPARVQILPSGGAPPVPGDFGERSVRSGRAHVAFTTSGSVELPVDPGTHEVIVSRGFEYEIYRETVTVTAGETVDVSAALDHSVDTTGVMCADYHIHTHRSPDSPDAAELKLAGLIADGLEIPVRSDHQWVNSFAGAIDDLGLSDFAYGMGGLELTTFAWGHFGVFPLVEDRDRPSGGAIDWTGRLPPEVFSEVRARTESPVLIINHPRSGGSLGGYFDAAGYDPDTGTVGRSDLWDDQFTLVETFNDKSFEEARDNDVRDWLSFLSSGRRVYAVGSSDSHNIYGSPVGYPRTCLNLGVDTTAELNDDLVRDATAAGHSTVSGGIYIDVTGPGDTGPGDDATAGGDSAAVRVRVQAANWIMGALRLEVIVDGATVETIPVTEEMRDMTNAVIRMDEEITVPVATEGSFVVFHVGSDADLGPVHPGREAFAVSNPLFLSR